MAALTLGSKLTFQETNQFVQEATSIMQGSKSDLVVDMGECQYLNSIMLSGLIRVMKVCEKQKSRLVLRRVPASARTLFETTNVLGLFQIEDKQGAEEEVPGLSLDYESLGPGNGLIRIAGSLSDQLQCTQFRDFYEKHIPDISNCVLDCEELQHLGSPGVTEMFRLRGMLQERDGRLVIASNQDAVESVWKMMHLESLIPKLESLEEAIKQFQS